MLRAAARPCIPNRKIKARIGTLPTALPHSQLELVVVHAHRRSGGNTNKSIINVTKTQAQSTVLFVWREVGGTHTSEGEVLSRPASLPLRGVLCGRTLDGTRAPPAPHLPQTALDLDWSPGL